MLCSGSKYGWGDGLAAVGSAEGLCVVFLAAPAPRGAEGGIGWHIRSRGRV